MVKKKEPPDKSKKHLEYLENYRKYVTSYKVTKTSLKSIIKDQKTILDINDIAQRVNQIVIHTYQFLKLFVLTYFKETDEIPPINEEFITNIMKVVSKYKSTKGGRPFGNNGKKQIDLLADFFEKHYEPLTILYDPISYGNLNNILTHEAESIMTCLKNHIQVNFERMLNQYINILINRENLKKTYKVKDINRRYRNLKTDLFENTSKAEPKDDKLKQIFKDRILKSTVINGSLSDQASSDPLSLLPILIRMSIDGEKTLKDRQSKEDAHLPVKTINCFPLRTSIIPKSIKIDTDTLVLNLFTDKDGNKSDYRGKGKTCSRSNEIWGKFFKIGNKCFKKKGYTFNRSILTDGVSCSILFVRNDLYKPDKKTNVHKVDKPYTYQEFDYIEKLSDQKLQEIRDKFTTFVGIDPGKADLIFATDGKVDIIEKNGKKYRKANTFTYSNRRRKMECKTVKYRKKLEADKKRTQIYLESVERHESVLSKHNANSCILENVRAYIGIKSLINCLLLEYYQKDMFRKLKWYSYINKQRSEINMMNRFKDKFGPPDKTLILMGDWSENQPKKYQEPTKGKSMRKLFKKNGYQLYLVNEFRTSIRSCETGEELKKIRYNPKRKEKCHRLLGSKIYKSGDMNETNLLVKDLMKCTGYRPIIIQRDLNGCINIRFKGWSIIFGLGTPYYLKRSYDPKPKKQKEIEIDIESLLNDLSEIEKVPKMKSTKSTKSSKSAKQEKPRMARAVKAQRNHGLKTRGRSGKTRV